MKPALFDCEHTSVIVFALDQTRLHKVGVA